MAELKFGDSRQDLDTLFGVRRALDQGAQRQVDLEGRQFDLDAKRRLDRESRGVDEALRKNAAASPNVSPSLRRLSATPGAGALAQEEQSRLRDTQTQQEKEILSAYENGNPAMAQALEARYGLNPLPDQFKADINAQAGAAAIIKEAGDLYGDDQRKALQYAQLRFQNVPREQAITQVGLPSAQAQGDFVTQEVIVDGKRVLALVDRNSGEVKLAADPAGQNFELAATGSGQQQTALQKNVDFYMKRVPGSTFDEAFNAVRNSAGRPGWLEAEVQAAMLKRDLIRSDPFSSRPENMARIEALVDAERQRWRTLFEQNAPASNAGQAPRRQASPQAGQQVGGAQSFESLTQLPAEALQTQTQQSVTPQQVQPTRPSRFRFEQGVGIVPQ